MTTLSTGRAATAPPDPSGALTVPILTGAGTVSGTATVPIPIRAVPLPVAPGTAPMPMPPGTAPMPPGTAPMPLPVAPGTAPMPIEPNPSVAIPVAMAGTPIAPVAPVWMPPPPPPALVPVPPAPVAPAAVSPVAVGGAVPSATLTAPRRVTVVTATARLDVALPAQCTIAELVPMLVRMTGAVADPAAIRYGWRLRRIGGPALPAGATVAAAELRDGEILHLFAGGEQGSGPVFDDLVDAIADAVQERPGRWSAVVSRRVAAGVAMVGFAVACVGVAAVEPIAAAALALVLLLVGGALSRSAGDARIGAAVTAGGLPGALAAGAALAGAPGAALAGGGIPGPAQVALGLAAAAVYAVLAAVLVADQLAWFAATAGAAALGGAVAVTVLATGVRPVSAAAVALVVITTASLAFPQIALRLARLPLPRIPADVAAFRADEEPTPGSRVADRARVAETALTALLAGMTAIVAGCGLVLLRTDSPWAWLLVGLCAPAMLLRSRAYLSVGQRCAVLVGAALTLVGTGVRLFWADGGQIRLILLATVLAVAVVAVVHAIRVVGQLRSPYLSRLLDVVEFVCFAALIPVALAVLGVYGAVRGLGG